MPRIVWDRCEAAAHGARRDRRKAAAKPPASVNVVTALAHLEATRDEGHRKSPTAQGGGVGYG